MGYEVDFLAVGDSTKSGDAIAVRFGNLHGVRSEQKVVVIDGGYSKNGDELVAHIKKHYGTEIVDLVILTHPDTDHVSGLIKVVEMLEVKELWMHLPWEHNDGIADEFVDGRVTDNSIAQRLKDSLSLAHDLYKLAQQKKIPVKEPFSGLTAFSGQVEILGPSIESYEKYLLDFNCLPEKVAEESAKSFFSKVVDTVAGWIRAFWGSDQIVDDGESTSPVNQTSAVTQFIVGGNRLLFTGDAGREALMEAAASPSFSSTNLKFIQIPHHGSFKNVGPAVLNKLIGKHVPENSVPKISAFCSAAKDGAPEHPSKKVLNAFTSRGANVSVTQGMNINHHNDAPNRGWSPISPLPFYDNVEDN